MASEQPKQYHVCSRCGQEDRLLSLEAAEQQLAQAREEAEKGRAAQHENVLLRQEIERLKDGNDQAQALLEQLTKDKRAGVHTYDADDYGLEAHVICDYCGEVGDEAEHTPDCPIVQARAFLAQHKEQGNE